MEHETFFTLLKDLPHWEFELFLMFIFDGVIGLGIWQYGIKKFFIHHEEDDKKIAVLEKEVEILCKFIEIHHPSFATIKHDLDEWKNSNKDNKPKNKFFNWFSEKK